MNQITILLIAFGLTFDTFAASTSIGLMVKDIRFKHATRLAIVMAFFQALMPLIGWFIGISIRDYIIHIDHWVAFGLLFLLGAKMIIEGLKHDDERSPFNPFRPMVIVTIAIATSIDALIAGVSFGLSELNIWLTIFLIGFLTYLMAMLGMLFGKTIGNRIGHRMEIVGGLMVIAIGVKILIEHLN